MVTMPDRRLKAEEPREAVEGRIIEVQKKPTTSESKSPEAELSLANVKKSRAGLFQTLKPLLPILSSGLRMVDHGAVQALAHLLNLADGTNTASSVAHEELRQGLVDLQSSQRELHLQDQNQTVAMQRLEDQITLLRQSTERNVARHDELLAKVNSLNNLVRGIGAGLAILLIILIALTVLALTHH
jgi:hypothetical protein